MDVVPAEPEPQTVPDPADTRPDSFYAAVGGGATFRKLVDAFYAGVASDPPLRALYPEEDLGPAADRLRWFLEQYWGGPHTYSQQRGHPRLRLRHVPYAIDSDQRDRWLRHMRAALDTVALPPAYDRMMWDYLLTAADTLRNTPD